MFCFCFIYIIIEHQEESKGFARMGKRQDATEKVGVAQEQGGGFPCQSPFFLVFIFCLSSCSQDFFLITEKV